MLVLISDEGESSVFPLGAAPATIGRDSDCDVAVESRFVSRRHARVELQGDSFCLVELGSVNPTLVNGEPIRGSRLLSPGDRISIADVTLEFRRDDVDVNATQVFAQPARPPVSRTPATDLSPTEQRRIQQLTLDGGTVTIMFTDLVNSTAITTSVGDARAQQYLRVHNAILRTEFAAHSGLEVKGQGDGFMVVFTSARQALRCAIAIQVRLREYNAQQPELPIVVRIGLNLGEVISEDEDFFGTAVILAARVAAQAVGEQVLISPLLHRVLEHSGEFVATSIGPRALKGFPEEQELFAVEWQDTAGGSVS